MQAVLRTKYGDEIDAARSGEQLGGLPKAAIDRGRVCHEADPPAAEPRESLVCENVESRERHTWFEEGKRDVRPMKAAIFAFFLALRQGHPDTFPR
jgi:hypothetical protein